MPDAQRLISTDDVRIANVRVGQVTSVAAARSANGRPYARIGLALQESVGRLPIDTQVRPRAASALGQTYVDLIPGSSRKTIPEGGTLPLNRARPNVVVSDLFELFNGNARQNFQTGFQALGDGFAGRGPALNSVIGSLNHTTQPLIDVSRALTAPQARLEDLIINLQSTMGQITPVRDRLGGFVSSGATTFRAIASEREALGHTLDALPGAEQSATTALRSLAPALRTFAQAATRLKGPVDQLPHTAAAADDAFRAGTVALRSVPGLVGPATTALSTLGRVSDRPSTSGALRKVGQVSTAASKFMKVILPAQLQCNTLAIFVQNTGSLLGSFSVAGGVPIAAFGLSTIGQPGEALQSKEPAPSVHVNNSPVENYQRCDSNNEPYTSGEQILKPPVTLDKNTTRETTPPPGVLALARKANLIATDGSR